MDALLRQDRRYRLKQAAGLTLYILAIPVTVYGLMWLAEKHWIFALILGTALALALPAGKIMMALSKREMRDEARQQASQRGREAAQRRERKIIGRHG